MNTPLLKVLLLVADGDLEYGVNHGFYSEFRKDNVSVASIDAPDSLRQIPFHSSCPPRVNCLYALDVYSGSYILIADENQNEVDSSDIFADTQAEALREALLLMGAKEISMGNMCETFRSASNDVHASGGNLIINADVNVNYSCDALARFSQKVIGRFPANKPVSVGEVESFINSHRLIGSVPMLSNLLSLMRRGGLDGATQEITVDVFMERNTALDIAVGLNINALGFQTNFQRKTNTKTHCSKTFCVRF